MSNTIHPSLGYRSVPDAVKELIRRSPNRESEITEYAANQVSEQELSGASDGELIKELWSKFAPESSRGGPGAGNKGPGGKRLRR